ncbi:MAG: DUF6091 family protein [Pseudomonadales bacterium]|nr:DUF6091 family protein [Pseudomonadales bacterium]
MKTESEITTRTEFPVPQSRRWASAAALTLSAAVFSAPSLAAESRSFCIFDPLGASGPVFNQMKAMKVQALSWGFSLDLQPYTDEAVAANDFRANQCDAVLLTDIRARDFNKFTATLVALGAIPSDDELKMLLGSISQPKAGKLMRSGDYEIAGIMPAGGVYVFTRDKAIHNVETIQGKKIATFDYDPAAMTMVQHVGASAVPATPSSFAGKFNNGSVDVAYAPAIAYKPLEMYKGVEPHGGVYSYKFAQMTFQMVINHTKFDTEFGQHAREYFFSKFDESLEAVKVAEADIPNEYWIHPSKKDAAGFDNTLKGVRVALREQGIYDPKALNLMLKVRCKTDPTRAECTSKTE